MPDKTARFPLSLKIVAALALLGAGAYAFLLYSRPTALVETVVGGEAVDAKPGSVTVKEEYSMQMKSQVAGRVLSRDYHLDPGMKIKEGDILVQLDPGDVEIEITQAKNALNSSKAKIAVGSTNKYALESAESDFTNTERLYKMGQISESDYNKARRAVQTIKQQQAMEMVVNQENLNLDETTLASKLREKDKMTITAPFDGQVSEVVAHPGDLIDSGSPIVSLITTTRVVEAKISEEDFANVAVGQRVTVIFLPYGEFEYNGTVKKILPIADPLTQRHLAWLDITDIPPAKLIPGITGEVSIIVGRHQAKAIVPRRALLNENVYVVKDGKVVLRRVKTGYEWLRGAEITEGLEPGEQVIAEDLENFKEGESVRTQELPSDVFSAKK